MAVRIQTEPFDIGEESARIHSTNAATCSIGAIVTFTGTVRAQSGTTALESMTLEHYPAMTQVQLENIEREARKRWRLDECLIVHRHGTLKPGENIVLVITASKHRADAFEAAAFLMDDLKTRAPFWKKEESVDGNTRWVEPRECDTKASKRWKSS